MRKNLNNFARLLAAGSALAVALPGVAHGQAAQGASTEDEIIVQARRKDESLQEVPLSIQAVSGNDLAKLEIRSFQDLNAVVPGLQLDRASNGIQNTVTMRGISFNPTAAGPQTAVELYRNDVVTSSAAIFQALYDIGQIEVLRGPQGTLRGRATPSGSISISTRKPNLSEVGGYASGSVAEGGKWVGEAAVNVPVISDRLGVRVAGYTSRDKLDVFGFNRFTNVVDKDVHDEVSSVRASVRAVPFVDVLTLDFNYETTKRETRSYVQYQSRNYVDGVALTGGVPDISSRDRRSIMTAPNEFDGTYKFYNWQAQLNLIGQQLTYVGGRLDAVSNAVAPEDAGGFLAVPFGSGGGVDVVDQSTAGRRNLFAQLTRSRQEQRFHEVRLQNSERIFGMFDYVVGYMNLKSNTPTLLYTPTSRCGPLPASGATCATTGLTTMNYAGVYRIRSDEENSYFGNLTMHLGDRTELSGGLRRISFDRISGLQSAGRSGATLLFDQESEASLRTRTPVASFNVNDTNKKTIYMLSAKHRFSDDVMVYSTFGTAFRPGNIIVCSRCNAAQGAALNAGGFLIMPNETSESIEAGIKTTMLDRKVTLNLSVYRQDFKNFTIISPAQIQFLSSYTAPSGGNPATGTLASFTNSFALPNDVRVTGFEMEFGWRPSDRFNLSGNVAYAKSKVKNGRVPCVDLDNNGFQDANSLTSADANTLAAQAGAGLVDTCPVRTASPAPKWSATMQGEYNMPVGFGEAYLRGLLNYAGKTAGDDVNPVDSVKAFALINAYIGVRDADGAWDVSLFARNLTNAHRVLTRSGSRAISTIQNVTNVSQYHTITTSAPREFGISARFAFGSR